MIMQFVIVGDFVFAFVGLVPATRCHERKGSRFASVQVEATPRVDVDETPCCISPQLGADITSLKTSSFNLKDHRSTAVVWVSGIVSLKEVAVGLGLAEWVEDGLIYAMVGCCAHDLRVHVQHIGLVSSSTCISVLGQRVGLATGLAVLMSGRVTDADWEGAGQRRALASVAGQEEAMRVATRTRR